MASVSVGKPAIRSAPNTTSGRSRRASAQKAMASARRCRRFMRLRMRSSPDCSDRCRCGISRGSLASASSRSRSASTESIDDSRSRFELRHVLEDLLDQRAELRRARQVGAIARDVDAGQHDLAIAVADQPAHVVDHGAHRHRARITAAERDDAEGAAVIAAILHLDESAGMCRKSVDQMRRGFLHRHDVADDGLRRAGRWRKLARACAQPVAESFSVLPSTRSASAMATKVCGSVCAAQPVTTILACGPLAPQRADRLPRLAHRLRRDRAGVDHDGIGKSGALGVRAGSPPIRRH